MPATVADAAPVKPNSDPTAIFRAPLLREGSQILEADASISHDAERGVWRAAVAASEPGQPARMLTLLPCARLTEIQRHLESASSPSARFELSGEVFVFRGQNYLLPTHAPMIESEGPLTDQTSSQSAATQPDPGAMKESKQSSDDSAQSILRELDRAAGPRTRNPGTAPRPTAERSPATGLVKVSAKVMREGTSITNRRGKISRDGSGAWLFIFDADASGQSDPPVKLLPCLLLERIEDHARKQGNNAPALLNGVTYVYGGQNYLLPTVFRIPQERRNLTP